MLYVFAKSMSDAEKLSYMKTDSPMDKEPELITLTKGSGEAYGAGSTCGYNIILDGNDWLLTDKSASDWSGAYKVAVPSSISGALFKAGVISDPTVGQNVKFGGF